MLMAEDVGVEPILLLTPTVRRGIASHARPLKIYISSRKFVASQAKSSSSRTARSTHLFSSCLLLVPVFTIRSAASCSDICGHKTALNKVASFCKRLSVAVGKLVAQVLTESKQQLQGHVESLEAIGREGVAISVERSSKRASPSINANVDEEREEAPVTCALMTLRSQVQTTFSSLVSAGAVLGRGRGVSFPRLFIRPVETMSDNIVG